MPIIDAGGSVHTWPREPEKESRVRGIRKYLHIASVLPLNCNYEGPNGARVRTIRINNMLLSPNSLTCQPARAFVEKSNTLDLPTRNLP